MQDIASNVLGSVLAIAANQAIHKRLLDRRRRAKFASLDANAADFDLEEAYPETVPSLRSAAEAS